MEDLMSWAINALIVNVLHPYCTHKTAHVKRGWQILLFAYFPVAVWVCLWKYTQITYYVRIARYAVGYVYCNCIV